MNYLKIKEIKKLYFGYEEISRVLGIEPESARVMTSRYVKFGFLVRVRRNIYVIKERWNNLAVEEKFFLANIVQVPSYISLMTALSYYEITTQIQRDFIESIDIKRTKTVEVANTIFNYTKINRNLYFGFIKERGAFIASPEKAFLDSLYLMSLKRYNFDLQSIDFSKLDMDKIKKLSGRFPLKTMEILKKNEFFKRTREI